MESHPDSRVNMSPGLFVGLLAVVGLLAGARPAGAPTGAEPARVRGHPSSCSGCTRSAEGVAAGRGVEWGLSLGGRGETLPHFGASAALAAPGPAWLHDVWAIVGMILAGVAPDCLWWLTGGVCAVPRLDGSPSPGPSTPPATPSRRLRAGARPEPAARPLTCSTCRGGR